MQTDKSDMTSEEIDLMREELNRLLEENRNLKDKLASKEISADSFERDGDKVRFYTALPHY